MAKYLKIVKELMKLFQRAKIRQIPREESERADIMANLRASMLRDKLRGPIVYAFLTKNTVEYKKNDGYRPK